MHPAAFLTPGFGGGCDLPLLEPAERPVGPDDQVGKGQQVDDASDRVDAAPTAMAHSDRRFDLDYSPIFACDHWPAAGLQAAFLLHRQSSKSSKIEDIRHFSYNPKLLGMKN